MEGFIQEFSSVDWAYVLFTADRVVFAFYFVAVCYLFIFAIGSVLKKVKTYDKAKKQYKYAVIFCVRDGSMSVIESLKSFDSQDYTRDKFDLIVVSNRANDQLIEQLERMSVQFIHAQADNYHKVYSLQYAMASLDESLYDAAVVMDAESSVDPNFLTDINNVYHLGGVAIQVHRTSKNLLTDTALFGAVSEEINNSIFRHGHVNMGFSSALIGSGMVFNYGWLKKSVVGLRSSELVKQLEVLLLQQSIFTEYLNDVFVYSEKADTANDYYQKHSADSFGFMYAFRKFVPALVSAKYDYADKLFQWMLPSRTILLGTLVMISVLLFVLSWGMALKWIVLLLFLTVAFSIATPDYFIDARFIKALRGAPLMFIVTVLSILKRKIRPRAIQQP